MSAEKTLLARIDSASQAFTAMLGNPHFYLELLLVGVSVGLALAVGYLARTSILRHTEGKKLKALPRFFLSLLPALEPLLAMFYLSIIQPWGVEYGTEGVILSAAIILSTAWLFSRLVFAFVRTRLIAWLVSVVIFSIALLDVTNLLEPAMAYLSSVAFAFGKYEVTLLGLLQGGIILVVVFWLASAISYQLEQYLRSNAHLSYNSRELIVKFFKVAIYFTAFMITLDAVGIDLTAFAIFGGALGVGIGLGLQKITSNFVSGVILLLEKSIKIGDLVEGANYLGWVRSLNMRYALIETFEGREVLVPNEELMTTRITNWTYSSEHARIEIKSVITYDSDPVLAQKLMLEAARAHPLCQKNPAPSCFLREFTETGISLLLTFWIPNVRDGRYGPQSEVMFDIRKRFGENNIEFSHDPLRKKPAPAQEAGG